MASASGACAGGGNPGGQLHGAHISLEPRRSSAFRSPCLRARDGAREARVWLALEACCSHLSSCTPGDGLSYLSLVCETYQRIRIFRSTLCLSMGRFMHVALHLADPTLAQQELAVR